MKITPFATEHFYAQYEFTTPYQLCNSDCETLQYETVSEADVIVLGAPIEGIYLAARALLEPSVEVVVLTPAYDALINTFEHIVGTGNVKR